MVFPYPLAKRLRMLGFFSPGSGRNVSKKKIFLVWGPRSQIPTDKKNNVFSSNSTKNTSDLKISSGYGQSRASYLENLLSEMRSDQTRRSYSRETHKRVFDFRYCNFLVKEPSNGYFFCRKIVFFADNACFANPCSARLIGGVPWESDFFLIFPRFVQNRGNISTK